MDVFRLAALYCTGEIIRGARCVEVGGEGEDILLLVQELLV